MKIIQIVCILSLVALSQQHDISENTKLRQNLFLETSSDFQEEINQAVGSLLILYQPWCGHCKQLIPTLEKVAEHYSEQGRQNVITIVNCTPESEFCEMIGIGGYPTQYFVDEQLNFIETEFRDYDNLVGIFESGAFDGYQVAKTFQEQQKKYIAQKYDGKFRPGSKVTELEDVNLVDTMKSKNSLILFHERKTTEKSRQGIIDFEEVASKYHEKMNFAAVSCGDYTSVCYSLRATNYPQIIYIYGNEQEETAYYKGENNVEAYSQFIEGGYLKLKRFTMIDYAKLMFNPEAIDDEFIYNDYQNSNKQLLEVFDDKQKVSMIAGSIGFLVVVVFLCLLKDCATRSTRKPKSN